MHGGTAHNSTLSPRFACGESTPLSKGVESTWALQHQCLFANPLNKGVNPIRA